MHDLFALDRALTPAERNRLSGKTAGGHRRPKAKGYAAPPGSGPAGETCGSCGHLHRSSTPHRTYFKCDLMQRGWTHGAASDVKARSPACSRWEAPETNPETGKAA